MATNPLYLNTLPSTEKEHKVELTLVKGQSDSNVSLSELMSQMCAMVQLLHLVEGELALNQSKMASLDNQAAQVNVDAVTAEGNQAIEATKAAIAAEQKPWWEKLLIAIFAVVMVALSYFTMGATAAILAAVVILITTVPLPFLGGKTLVGYIASKIAEAIGQDCGWSKAQIQEATGYINLALGVLLAVASLGAGFAGATVEAANAAVTVVEDVVDEGMELTDMAANGASSIVEDSTTVAEETVNTASTASKAMNIGKFSAVNAFVSQVANSNCIEDIMMGTLLNVNPNATEKEKETIAIIAAVLNLIVAVIGAFLGGKIAISSISGDLEEGSSLAQKLIGTVETANGLGQASMNGYQGIVDINVGELNAAVTRIEGAMQGSKQITALIGLTMNQINTLMKDIADEYKILESSLKNIGMYDSAEVNALLKGNQQS
jgi:hypothetical protein